MSQDPTQDWLDDQDDLADEEADAHMRSIGYKDGWQDLGWTTEPIGYDGFGAPLYAHQIPAEGTE